MCVFLAFCGQRFQVFVCFRDGLVHHFGNRQCLFYIAHQFVISDDFAPVFEFQRRINGQFGHDDDRAVELNQKDESWGWLLEKGASLIQTDRPAQLLQYLKGEGRR